MCVNVVLVIIHPLFKKRKEKKSLLQSEQEPRLKHKIHKSCVGNTVTHYRRMMAWGGGDKKTLQAFFKVRVHAQITFTEYIYIYMYCIYMYIHTEKIFPKEMIKYSRSLLMQ